MDLRCGMELDEIDPLKWAALEAATEDYIVAERAAFDAATHALTHAPGGAPLFPSEGDDNALDDDAFDDMAIGRVCELIVVSL